MTMTEPEHLLFTHESDEGPRRSARESITELSQYSYGKAYFLAGGQAAPDSVQTEALAHALADSAPAIVAFALHHLGEILPDLTVAQRARIDDAAVELSVRVCEELSGA